MSVSTYIAGIKASRDKIHDKLVAMQLAQSGDKLASLANAIEGIQNHGAVNGSVQEGGSYVIPQGYHNGKGSVQGVGGGGSYALEPVVEVEPTRTPTNVTPGEGYYGLSGVLVKAIPSIYQDVSDVDAEPGQVLAGKIYVTADGTPTAGEMPNLGAVSASIDGLTADTSYTIPKGYHNGSGKVSLTNDIENALAAI